MTRMGTLSAVVGAFCLLAIQVQAGVRVQYQGPQGLQETIILSGTAHASTTLPGALALPQAMVITPTLVPLAEVGATVSGPVAATGAGVVVSATAVAPSVTTVLIRSGKSKAACLKSLNLLGELAALGSATGSRDGAAYMQIVASAALLQGQVEAGQPGDWTPVGTALRKVPRSSKIRDNLLQAGDYAKSLCRPDNSVVDTKSTVSWPR